MIPEPLEQASDEALVRQALQGHEAAWNELVSRYHGKGARYIRQQLDDPHLAQDIMQAVWINVVQRLQEEVPRSFGALFWTVLKRRIIDQIRKRSRNQEWLELDAPARTGGDGEAMRQWASGAPDPVDEAIRSEEASELYQALDRLPDHYAAVIRARALEGLSNRETARLLLAQGLIQDDGNAEKRVENYWYRGLKELARQLKAMRG